MTIPLFITALCINLVTRLPDAYVHNIRSEGLSEEGIYISGEELGNEISRFMRGADNSISTIDPQDELYEYYKNFAADFSGKDYALLRGIKTADDILAVLGGLALLWSVIMFIYHVREGYETKHNMRRLFLISLIVEAGLLLAALIAALRMKPGDMLSFLFPARFPCMVIAYAAAVSALVTAIIAYIIWYFTKPRDTFNERRYFR